MPPWWSAPNAEPLRRPVHQRRRGHHAHEAAVGGGVLRQLLDGRGSRHAGRATGHRAVEDVLLAPEHALRRARRAAGVEDVEVVRRGLDRRHAVGRGREGRLVVQRTGQERVAALVGDLDQDAELWQPVADARQVGRVAGVIDDRYGVRVGEQVEQLVVDVAVVDVEGCDAREVRAQHALEVLRAVEHVDAEVVLSGLVVLELGALAAAAEAVRVEDVGEPTGALGDLGVGEAARGGDDALPVGVARCDGLLGESEIHGRVCAPNRPPRARVGARQRCRLRQRASGQEACAARRRDVEKALLSLTCPPAPRVSSRAVNFGDDGRRVARRSAVLLAVCLATTVLRVRPAQAVWRNLTDPVQRVSVFVIISPDSRFVVYTAAETEGAPQELFSVALAGGMPTKLNPPLVTGGNVNRFGITPDGTSVVYTATQDTAHVQELYIVPIGGGQSRKLNAPLVAGGHVDEFVLDPATERALYIADGDTAGTFELYSVPLSGGAVVKLNPPLVAGGNVSSSGLQVDPSSKRAVYLADQEVAGREELFSVPAAGGTSTKLNADGTMVTDVTFEIASGGPVVVFQAANVVGQSHSGLFSNAVAGGLLQHAQLPARPGPERVRFPHQPRRRARRVQRGHEPCRAR